MVSMGKVKRFFKNLKYLFTTTVITEEESQKLIEKASTEAVVRERSYQKSSKDQSQTDYLPEEYRDKYHYYRHEVDPVLTFDENRVFKGLKDSVKKVMLKIAESATGNWITIGAGGSSFKRALTNSELFLYQSTIFERVQRDPIAQAIVNNIEWYVIGNGTRIECSVPDIAEVINDFRKLNSMSLKEKSMVRSGFMDGEYFIRFIADKKGDVLIRKVPTHQIHEIEVQSDVDSPLAYKRVWQTVEKQKEQQRWYPDIEYFDQIKREWKRISSNINGQFRGNREFVQFIKYGEEGEVRGRPPMFSTLRFLKMYDDHQVNRAILNHERSKVVWVRTVEGEYTHKNLPHPMESPIGGIILEEKDGVKYRTEVLNLDSADSKVDGDSLLMTIGAFRNIPIHILHQDPSQSVYASIKKADTPFSQMIEAEQDFWREHWEKMHNFVVKMKILRGELNRNYKVPIYSEKVVEQVLGLINQMVAEKEPVEKVVKSATQVLGAPTEKSLDTENIIISQIFPQTINDDPLATAKVLQVHQQMGIVSQATAASKVGYNWFTEFSKLIEERDNGASEFVKETKLKDDQGLDEDRDRGKTKFDTLDRK